MHIARGRFPAVANLRPVSSVNGRQADPEHHMGWMVNHVQAGDRVAVADHEAGSSAAAEPGQPEELARGPAWPPTPARVQNALCGAVRRMCLRGIWCIAEGVQVGPLARARKAAVTARRRSGQGLYS